MSGYVVMYREAVKGNDEWSPWLRLSEKVHETIEDSNKELEEEIQDDEEWGTGDFSYIYRTMTEKEAENTTSTDYGHVSPEDLPVVRSEAGAGPLSVAVPVERLEALEGIELRLEAALAEHEKSRSYWADELAKAGSSSEYMRIAHMKAEAGREVNEFKIILGRD